jgi:hypothetical protein
MHPAARFWRESKLDHIDHIKVDNIKHFRTLVLRNARKQLPVRASRYTDDRHHMRTIMLDELDARLLFLPQLEMAIDRGRNDKVRACNGDKVYHVAMHETLVVPVCAWQMVQEKPFMWENFAFLFRDGDVSCALWHGHWSHVVIALIIVLLYGRGWIHLCIF